MQAFNSNYKRGFLFISRHHDVISLLFKKGDRTHLKNWWLVTLLNIDYKILPRALANRLKSTVTVLINSDQTPCITGHTINNNLRLMQHTIIYVNETNSPLALITADHLKVFHCNSHSFLFKILHKIAFGLTFIQWIESIYDSESSFVTVNHWLTTFIPLQRDLCQGYALSILTSERLAIHILFMQKLKAYYPHCHQPKLKIHNMLMTQPFFLLTQTLSMGVSGTKINT